LDPIDDQVSELIDARIRAVGHECCCRVFSYDAWRNQLCARKESVSFVQTDFGLATVEISSRLLMRFRFATEMRRIDLG
jgi:hypothetical protein